MGTALICGSKQKPSSTKKKTPKTIITSNDILNEQCQKQINQVIDECIRSLPTTYQNERERIVNEMRSAAPNSYLGLFYSEYPEKNGSAVNEMTLRLVISDEAKEKLLQQIHERLETENIVHFNTMVSKNIQAEVKHFILKATNSAIDRLVFE